MQLTLTNDNRFAYPGRDVRPSTRNPEVDFWDTTVRKSIFVCVVGPSSNVAHSLRSPDDVQWLNASARDLIKAVRQHEPHGADEDFERWLADFV